MSLKNRSGRARRPLIFLCALQKLGMPCDLSAIFWAMTLQIRLLLLDTTFNLSFSASVAERAHSFFVSFQWTPIFSEMSKRPIIGLLAYELRDIDV